MENKKGKLHAGMFKGLILVAILATIFFAMAPSLVHTVALGQYTLLTELTNTTLYGATGGSVATTVRSNVGALWIVGALVFIISVIGGFFAVKGRRR